MQTIILLIIFFLPSNLFFKINLNSAIINGNLVDYLLPKIYLTDLLILILFFLSYRKKLLIINKKRLIKFVISNLVIISLIIGLISYQFLTNKPIAAMWYLLKIIEIIFLFNILKGTKISKKSIFKTINLSLLFQSILGIYQFYFQKSLLPYYFLGESQLKANLAISMGRFFGIKYILPYGTTAHSNILAGVLSIYWLLLFRKALIKKTNKYFLITTVICFYCLLLTQSLSAYLTIVIGITIILFNHAANKKRPSKTLKNIRQLLIKIQTFTWKKSFFLFIFSIILIPITILFMAKAKPNILSFTRRQKLNHAALIITGRYPLFGVGLNNFTARVGEYYQDILTSSFIQPVHHLGLLILAETGFIGLTTLIIILKKHWNPRLAKILFIYLPIITLDHYLLTNQVGLLLLTTSLVLF